LRGRTKFHDGSMVELKGTLELLAGVMGVVGIKQEETRWLQCIYSRWVGRSRWWCEVRELEGGPQSPEHVIVSKRKKPSWGKEGTSLMAWSTRFWMRT